VVDLRLGDLLADGPVWADYAMDQGWPGRLDPCGGPSLAARLVRPGGVGAVTRRFRGALIIEPEAALKCELCGKIAETRPYGPNGQRICFGCGQKDPETTKRQFLLKAFGEGSA